MAASVVTLGIDVSKDHLSCSFFDAEKEKVVGRRSVSNTEAGILDLLSKTPKSVPLVVEPTGNYSTFVAKVATKEGYSVLLAPPKKAKAFLYSLNPRAKTDTLDADGLARYGTSGALSPYPVKSAEVERMHQMLTARKGLAASVTRLNLQKRELPAAKEALGTAVTELKKQIAALTKDIAQIAQKLPEKDALQQLQRVPGIGPVTAATVVCCLTERRFPTAHHFVAYCGLDIVVNDSGKRTGVGRISHQGDAELRRLFYLAAQASLRAKDSPFKAQYERERTKGLSTTAALCAVARKIARLSWSLVKHNSEYDPTRIYKQ